MTCTQAVSIPVIFLSQDLNGDALEMAEFLERVGALEMIADVKALLVSLAVRTVERPMGCPAPGAASFFTVLAGLVIALYVVAVLYLLAYSTVAMLRPWLANVIVVTVFSDMTVSETPERGCRPQGRGCGTECFVTGRSRR